ncbi:Uncharacterized conserved protein, DUF1697 family [Desulfitobacterium chlororespirans DSM 11544]|uniref:Uncharacterized conserved protein, DUF1697 family n=2 Tax=Desulfitobacterium chlororespirans TaxID=51616 RepID=A0A1M7UGF7_9FIRM|nr:Uncharacterized conserved protein, DUF1697 family [Desulfitobacterium chlororespirans DSM 11544]
MKMTELKKLFSDLGFQKVQTYIQSGNVVFDTEDNATQAMQKIQKGFSTAFGFECAVMLRTAREMADMVEVLPFSEGEINEAVASNPAVEHLYVYLLDGADIRQQFDGLICTYTGRDRMVLGANEIYLLCHESIRDSKLATSLGKLKVSLTARNWKTISKLYEITRE